MCYWICCPLVTHSGYVYERCGRRFLSRLHLLSSSSSSSPWPRYYHWPFSNVANKAHVLG